MNIYQPLIHVFHKPPHVPSQFNEAFPYESVQEMSQKKTAHRPKNTQGKKVYRGHVDINCA